MFQAYDADRDRRWSAAGLSDARVAGILIEIRGASVVVFPTTVMDVETG